MVRPKPMGKFKIFFLNWGGYCGFLVYWMGTGGVLLFLTSSILDRERAIIDLILAFIWGWNAYMNHKCATIKEARRRNEWGRRAVILYHLPLPETAEEIIWLNNQLKKNLKEMEYWYNP